MWSRVREGIQKELSELTPTFFENWVAMSETPLALDQEEMDKGLESCLWALYFLKMVEECERGLGPADAIAATLDEVQEGMDSVGDGCRIRYARGMLQEYASSGRTYAEHHKALYFGEWIYNCNHQKLKDEERRVKAFSILGELLTKSDPQRSWYT